MRTTVTTDSLAFFELSFGSCAVLAKGGIGNGCRAENFVLNSDEDTVDGLRRILLSYESRPIALCGSESTAFVIPSFAPSCGIYLLAIPSACAETVSFAIKNRMLGDIVTVGELSDVPRSGRRTVEEAHRLRMWLDSLDGCFGVHREEKDEKGFGDLLLSRVLGMAEFFGVNIKTARLGDINDDDRFDLGLFTAFTSVLMAVVKLRSINGCACVSIGENEHGVFVKTELRFDGRSPRYDRELMMLHGIADRKRILFEVLDGNGSLSVSFSPVIEDWSLLEVKEPDDEETEFELS